MLKFAAARREVFFLRLEKTGLNLSDYPLPAGIQLVEWNPPVRANDSPAEMVRLMPAFQSVLDELKPDVVQAGPVQTLGLLAALSDFHPFILMSWGSDILLDAGRDALMTWATRYALTHADYFLCDCAAVRHTAQALTPFDDSCILQFPWGIDSQQFTPGSDTSNLRERLGWQNCFVLLSTRSWEPLYGIETLLDAFACAYGQNPNLRLMLLGSGSLAAHVQSRITVDELGKVIYRPGLTRNDELPNYFRAADLYMSCALSDGSSISLLEALATGRDVLVTDIPSNREWVATPDNGWLAAASDATAFANAILASAARSSAEREQVAQRNRALAVARADWDKNFEILAAGYDQIEQASKDAHAH